MESNARKIKWRLNLFDVVFIVCVIAAVLIVTAYLGRSGGGGIISSGSQQTVVYTIILSEMIGDTAYMIQPGDELFDKVERRMMGKVESVEVIPSMKHEGNHLTGDRVLVELPGRKDAVVVVTAEATVTDNQISIGGFVVRSGVRVSVLGPLYHGVGFIVSMERNET